METPARRFIDQLSCREHWVERTRAPATGERASLYIVRVSCDRPCGLKEKGDGGLANREGEFRWLRVNFSNPLAQLILRFNSSLNYLGPGNFVPAGVCFSCLFGVWSPGGILMVWSCFILHLVFFQFIDTTQHSIVGRAHTQWALDVCWMKVPVWAQRRRNHRRGKGTLETGKNLEGLTLEVAFKSLPEVQVKFAFRWARGGKAFRFH